MNLLPGTKRLTADAELGTSGKPLRIFSVCIHSAGSGASTAAFRNGTLSTDDAYFTVDGIADQTVMANFAGGIRFPNGCYVDLDANIEYATITYTEEF